MNTFYEDFQDKNKQIYYRCGKEFFFRAHFHQKVEIFALAKGTYTVYCNGKKFCLKGGDIAFFDSYDIHSYEKSNGDCDGLVLIFPLQYIEKFLIRKNGLKIENKIISSPSICQSFMQLGKEYIVQNGYNENVKSGVAELILALIEPHLQYSKEKKDGELDLIQNLLIYINENFTTPISLKNLAKKFGYSPEHVSRVFHQYLNTGLPEYVNRLRLNFLERELKKDGNKKITTLLFEAGFNSIQSYYRVKNRVNNWLIYLFLFSSTSFDKIRTIATIFAHFLSGFFLI